MDDEDILRPNGTCYSLKNREAAGNFIPCGNAGLLNTHFPCCGLDDYCMSSNTCFHGSTGITYIAGCTDQTYSHPACPQKLYFQDQEWLGLVRCGTSDDFTKKDEEWAGCQEEPDQSLDVAPSKCDCEGKQALFRDSPSLDSVASLPADLDGTISYFPGHTPTMRSTRVPHTSSPASSTSSSRAASSSKPTNTPATTSPPSTLTSSANPDPPELTLGTKLGAGLGSSVGVLLIGCMVFMALLLRKRKKQQEDRGRTQHQGGPPPPAATEVTRTVLHRPSSVASSAVSPGFRSELPADEPPKSARSNNMTTSPSPESSVSSPATLLPPYNHNHQHQHGVANAPQQRYQAYDPRIHGDYGVQQQQHLSTISDVSGGAQTPTPDRYGSIPISLHHPETGQQQQHPPRPPVPPVSEMQG